MDSTPWPVARDTNCNKDFENPHFKPLWEPDTTVGRNAIKYSLVHHMFQKFISTAGLCTFCTDELTRRVSEAARRLKSRDLFHDDKGHMDLFWQDANDGAFVAGETVVTADKHGEKIAVADHALRLSRERSDVDKYWWSDRVVMFQREIADLDRSETSPSRGASWFGFESGRHNTTPWETRFLAVIWIYTLGNAAGRIGMDRFIRWQEKYLNFTHERCQCVDVQRLRSGVSFETVLMERVLTRISRSVWEVIQAPPDDIRRSKKRFLSYFEEQSSGLRREESIWDYAFSQGESLFTTNEVVPRPLPRGWQRRWVSNNTVWYHDSRGKILSLHQHYSCLPNETSATPRSTVDEEEDLIEL